MEGRSLSAEVAKDQEAVECPTLLQLTQTYSSAEETQ